MNLPVLAVMLVAASLALLCAVPAPSKALPRPADETPDANTAAVVEGANAFGFDLYAHVRGGDKNLFLSPYSIDTALAMTDAGARGETAAEMAKVLHLPDLNPASLHRAIGTLVARFQAGADAGYELHVANALWGRRGTIFTPEYLDLVRKNYGAQLTPVDFTERVQAARTINDWVAAQTKDKIKDLISPSALDASTRLVLTNAIYFKGTWESTFSPAATRGSDWHAKDGTVVRDVPTMHQTGSFESFDDDGLSALQMSYKGGDIAMLLLLPSATDGLSELEKSLDAKKLAEVVDHLHRRQVSVSLPKFKVESKLELGDTLKAMGMPAAFSASADFSGMGGDTSLQISDVVHKAYVDVDESGTEAAAATGVTIRATAIRETPAEFNADHPFLLVIRDTSTGMVLFIGRVTEPSR